MPEEKTPLDKTTAYVIVISCRDTIGIVAAVSGFLASNGAFITESSHFGDAGTQRFFMRTTFLHHDGLKPIEVIRKEFSAIAARFEMDWSLRDMTIKSHVLILVSKFDHCLNDLLYRYRIGALPIEIPAVASNHTDLARLVSWHDIPYHYFPVTPETKEKQEAQILDLIDHLKIDLIVLARYMQVLSPELCRELSGRAINIHHSFLPSFKGAKPYHQAHARGVKLIGATAHYVTTDLDEGPVIEQETQRVDHTHSAEEFVALGRDIENLVLSRAVRFHTEHRVIINGTKTVVFR